MQGEISVDDAAPRLLFRPVQTNGETNGDFFDFAVGPGSSRRLSLTFTVGLHRRLQPFLQPVQQPPGLAISRRVWFEL